MTAFIRPMRNADRQFVISGWSSSYRTSFHAGMLSMASYSDVMHREIARIIDHETTLTLVAEEPGETVDSGKPFLYGFIAARPPDYVYYVYVKAPYREGRRKFNLPQGYAEQLLRACRIEPTRHFSYACRTAYCSELSAKIPLAEFNPLPARYLEHHDRRDHTQRREPLRDVHHPEQ